ncbi:MAG: FHA domain-containing protein [Prevotella sp.]|jgi:predicted RNA-binding Zn-ribbon protein involved in translation (DUF1610 family)
MKRLRCPKCSNYITFDETSYSPGQVLAFTCPNCGKKFAIRLAGASKTKQAEQESEEPEQEAYGYLHVIENVFHYKQVIPITMGENVIGRFTKGTNINCPIKTDDPSIDPTHCVINASRDKKGNMKYILRDGPSNTGTFVNNEILGDRERRVIEDGTLFTIGATSIIFNTQKEE